MPVRRNLLADFDASSDEESVRILPFKNPAVRRNLLPELAAAALKGGVAVRPSVDPSLRPIL